MDEEHGHDEERDDDEDEPRPEGELGDREDERHDAGRDGTEAVDRDARAASHRRDRATVADHAGLRERDRGEDADRVERDEGLDPAAEDRQDDDRQDGQGDDAGVNASRSPRKAKRLGMNRPGRSDGAREVGEAGVGGEDQDAHRRQLEDVVRRRPPEDGPPELREDGLVVAGIAPRPRRDRTSGT